MQHVTARARVWFTRWQCARLCLFMLGTFVRIFFFFVFASYVETYYLHPAAARGFPKQVQGRDRDRAAAAFCWCNRKLIETINMVLIIKAQVLRWRFADCWQHVHAHSKRLTRCFVK